MGQIWIREFIGGLDVRRLPETSPGSVILRGVDGHINRGGEFEQRAAFVPAYTLPEGTVGLAHMRTGIVVFGSGEAPVMPAGVTYQRLQHPEGISDLIDVPGYDLYAGKIYAVGQFSDGSTHHFYDGVRVEDWFDGRARAAFTITGGVADAAVSATGSFAVTGGTLGVGNEITNVKVNGITVTSAAVAHTGDDATTAEAIATDINSHASVPDYSAYSIGATVYIVANDAGAASNGYIVAATVGGDATVGSQTAMAGGSNSATSVVSAVRVNGVDVLLSPVEWQTSHSATAAAVAEAINASLTDPEYTAVADGATVVILADESEGADINDAPVDIVTANGLTVSPISGLVMSGGAEVEDAFTPGTFVKTIGAKMYSPSGPNMHFSGIQQPTQWTTDAVGAGFIDMSTYASGAEEVRAVATYQGQVAVFSEGNIQIWYVDPDPTLYRIVQTLNNTGTTAPRSVTQFGDNDLFYLDESGVRSLRARDSSNAASTTDIGVAIDPLVIEQMAGLSDAELNRVVGLIEPRDGRFWLVMKDKIFILSFFSGGGAKGVSAWTYYTPGFDVEHAVVFNKKVYLRSGDTVYVYGGLTDDLSFDDTEAVLQTPYLDGDDPTREKTLSGIDAAARGEWTAYIYQDPNNPAARDKIGIVDRSTFRQGRITANGASTHFSLAFVSKGGAGNVVSSAVIHFESAADQDK